MASQPPDPNSVDVTALRQRIAELERQLQEQKHISQEAQNKALMIDMIIESIPIPIFCKDVEGCYISCNTAFEAYLGRSRDEIIGATVFDLAPSEFAAVYHESDLDLMRQEVTQTYESKVRHADGSDHDVLFTKAAFQNADGSIGGLVGTMLDITDRKRYEMMIETQSALLRELSTPLIPIRDDILVMPLIGAIDSFRAQQIVGDLLEGVSKQRVRFAILDITGVAVVDTQIANTLVHAAQAVRLLGAQALLTGIRPDVAQTLVSLGVDLSDIITLGTLQAGITFAIRQQRGQAMV